MKDLLFLTNVVMQVYFFQKYFHGNFVSYSYAERDILFPKVTACHYNMTGAHEANVYATCFLSLNSYYDKLFLGLWYVYLLVGILNLVLITYRLLYVSLPPLRLFVLRQKAGERAEHLVPEIMEGLNYIESVSESLFLSVLLQNLDNDRSLQLLELL